jgi:two-component sensor histidine kinase
MNILLIEDDADYAETLVEIFQSEGHYIKWVVEFLDIYEAMNLKKWDIILSDVHMKVSVLQIIDLYNSYNVNTETPLIFLTAERNTDLASELSNRQEFPVISKFEIKNELLEVITKYNLLFRSVQDKKEKVSRSEFKRFIVKSINDEKYKKDDLKQSLSGWLTFEQSILSNIATDILVQSDDTNETGEAIFKSGYLKLDKSTLEIVESSPSIRKFYSKGSTSGYSVIQVLPFAHPEKVLKLLKKASLKDEHEEQFDASLLINSMNVNYSFKVYTDKADSNQNSNFLQVEIFRLTKTLSFDTDNLILKETNKYLLKELHHRVNNSLQIILSLVNLKLLYASEDEVEIYTSIQNYVLVVSLVYQYLNDSDDVSNIRIYKYISDLVENYIDHNKTVNKVETQDENLVLNVNQVIPLGLLINELCFTASSVGVNFSLDIRQEADLINITIEGENAQNLFYDAGRHYIDTDQKVITTLLDSLNAIVTTGDDHNISIRFKKVNKKGIGSTILN